MIRKGSAEWKGDLKGGTGTFSTESGALKEIALQFRHAFRNPCRDRNPEELIGAALAGCFSMYLCGRTEQGGDDGGKHSDHGQHQARDAPQGARR